ncbi:hypothetical protein IW261DRAFT_792095 [Armillaria novae-zelandiae]|uniref:NTF2 domain-containing protein n=1 Tax=Armillaria novae-zelandiae TaxID=153914 RepID=A0AA39PL57_9AGAR|nr:hypothetical protein IW261DRAFT_792095 [Armillaria novae-zelandiae]
MYGYAQRNHYPTTSASNFGKGKSRRVQETTAHAEDYQPNESINKRKQAAPPVISTSSRGGRPSIRGAGLRGGSSRASFSRRQSGARGSSLRAYSNSSLHPVAPWNPFRIHTPPAPFSSATADGPSSNIRNNTEAIEIRVPAVTMEPQNKRQKLTHEENAVVAVSTPCSHPPDASLKTEEADVGVTLLATPTTTGSKWYHPLPPDCQKSHLNWSANRKHWFKLESKFLKSRGLNILRSFFRDDGMVIDWSSPVPVWSDTLQPEQSSSSSPYPPLTTTIPSKSKKQRQKSKASKWNLNGITSSEPVILPGPDPAPSSDNNISITSIISSNIQNDELEIIVVDDDDSTQPALQMPTVKTFTDVDCRANMESDALQYLKQYVLTFDRDRSLLREAYTKNALFSYSIVRDKPLSMSEAHLFSGCETSSNTTLRAGPADIVEALSSFGKHQFFPRHATLNADYDLLSLGNDQILLTVHGQVVDPRSNEEDVKVAVDQSFVLCSNEILGPWPLVAISHQMVLRDRAWLPASQLRLPWL